METTEKIKTEIERRLKANGAFDEVGDDAWAYDQGIVDAYKSILSFIKSLEKENEPKIKGWVARGRDDELSFFTEKPRRLTCCWIGNGFCDAMILMENFPDLKFEDDPIEVELIIKRV